MAEGCELVVVSHTHWDREWYKSFEHYRYRLVQAMDELIEAMEQEEGYTHFLLDGQTVVIEDYLELRPERREGFARLAGAGRISLGPWYLQPDEQLVAGESLVRNLLIGHRMAAQFGEVMKEGYVPDTFGHIAQLPQILAGFDIPSFYSMRGTADDLDSTRSEVYWEAPDGSRVWTHHLLSYSNAAVLAARPETMRLHHGTNIAYDSLEELKALLLRWSSSPVLLLMNGNDHLRPQPRVASLVSSLDDNSEDHIFLGSLGDFRRLSLERNSDLAVVRGERTSGRYQKILQGVLSTRMYLKQRNARLELLLSRVVEPLWVMASTAGARYPAIPILAAWKHLLRNHPHDSICGCSIDRVHRDMAYRFDQAEDIAEALLEDGLETLSANVRASFDEERDEIAILVANPSQLERGGVVRVAVDPAIGYPFGEREFAPSGYRTIDLDGYRTEEGYPVRVAGEELFCEDILNRRKMVTKQWLELRVDSVPALGYTTVVLHRDTDNGTRSADSPRSGKPSALHAGDRTIENEHLEVICEPGGTLTVVMKENGRRFAGMHLLEDEGDRGDEYTFCPTDGAPLRSDERECRVETIDRAPNAVELRISQVMSLPAGLSADRTKRATERTDVPIESIVRLTAGSRYAEITTNIDNRVGDHRLRAVFPAGFSVREAAAESAFAVVRRPVELPDATGWSEEPTATRAQARYAAVDAPDGSAGIALFNRGLPEYEVTSAGELKLTLLRSVGWLSRPDLATRRGNAGPPIETSEAQCLGPHTFEYALRPYTGSFEEAEVWRDADAYTLPLIATRIRRPGTQLPARWGLFELRGRGLVLTSVKHAEEGEGIILRLFNTLEEPAEGTLECGIALSAASTTNLNEETREPIAVENGRTLRFRCPGYRIMTLRLSPA